MLYVKGKVFGAGKPLICVPVIAEDCKEIISQCKKIRKNNADIIEIRADYVEDLSSLDASFMEEVREVSGDALILYTFRSIYEGGQDNVSCDSVEKYLELLKHAAEELQPDLIDIEVNTYKNDLSPYAAGEEEMINLIEHIRSLGVTVIGSMHDFEKTPPVAFMEETFESMNRLGVDIFKIAVMPNCDKDVMNLMSFASDANDKYDNPIIAISMGSTGVISRVACGLSGSAVTFACVGRNSAPGQMDIDDVREIIDKISKKNIYLIGYMGCGKSVVSKRISQLTGIPQTDTDRMIAEETGMTIPEIFVKYGEEYFRKLETGMLIRLSTMPEHIVACGGGIALREENVAIMKKTGTVFLLTAEPKEIFRRVSHSTNRPLLNDNMNIEYIEDMMTKRKESYNKAADIVIGTDNADVNEVAEDVIKYLED